MADGSGNVTSARLFQATNAGVSDTGVTASAGTYSIVDCENGTVVLTFGAKTLHYNIDPSGIDSNNLAHDAAMLDADANRDESFEAVRTVDPVAPYACGNGFALTGVAISAAERGHTNAGQPESGLVAFTYGTGTLSGTEKISTPGGFTTNSFTGTYTIQPDCSVLLTRTVNGTQVSGAHIITGGDSQAENKHSSVWQGDYEEEEAALVIDNGSGMDGPH